MKLSPIQLLNYHVTSLNLEACASFDGDKPMDLDPDDLDVSAQTKLIDDGDNPQWAVSLDLRFEPGKEKNSPYRLAIKMVGLVSAIPKKVDESLNHAVGVNGPSMLFGAAREILRDATARGPNGPIIIPSASFFTSPPKLEHAPVRDAPPTAGQKRTALKKKGKPE